MILQKLSSHGLHGLLIEVWGYLVTKDICHLLVVDKEVRRISLIFNNSVPQDIVIDLIHISQVTRENIFKNIIFSFPNISKLFFVSNSDSEIGINESIRVFYNSKSICQSLKDLTIPVLLDNGVKGISKLTNIKYLSIQYSLITNKGLYEIGLMSSIISLELKFCKNIGDEGLYHISKLLNIISLKIYSSSFNYNNYITDTGLSHLCSLTNLTSLNLSYFRNITTLSHFSSLTKITALSISYCPNLSDEGLSYISSLSNLIFLDLSFCWNMITLFHFCSLTNITSLIIPYCYSLTDEGLSFISSLSNLTYLNLNECTELTYTGLSHLSSLSKIETLNVLDCLSSDLELFHIFSIASLRYLKMNLQNGMTNNGFIELCKLTNLDEIYICNSGEQVFEDIDLSQNVIDKLVDILKFYIHDYKKCLKSVDGVRGFLYVLELREQKSL